MVDQYRYIMALMYILTHTRILRRKRREMADHLAVLTDLELEIMVLGTGATLRFPSPATTAPLIE